MPDEEIINLLPWYVNDTLSEDERKQVEQLLTRSEEAREEEAFLRSLSQHVQSEAAAPVSELGWKRLQRDIRAEEKAPVRDWWKPGIAAAATVMLALQVGLWVQQPAVDNNSRLLSQALQGVQERHWLLQVEFKDESSWQAVAELINNIDGRVVDGPSSIGLVRIALPIDNKRFTSAQQLLDWLQQQPQILHAAVEGE
ncbi:hypothetical protein [Oceanicoccus sp. KOV_DT_Chl]|uniref:hypothetical protein n=1 Tax=Oceanicoccus sp. KOV_DT_Chl TaxID=1904639 RepID=UPI000C7E8078|nr:hypothetical protein [Oceanicoccus sp. KOV_DT_Chl]